MIFRFLGIWGKMNVCIVLPRGDDQTSVSVCVRGGGIRQAVSGPFLSRGAFCQPHSFSLPADTSLQEPPRTRLHQSVPMMPLINLFFEPDIS